jgi:hypothetical protein
MKHIFPLAALFVLASCTPPSDAGHSSSNGVFTRNCETAMALIQDFDNEDLSAVKAHFADSAVWLPTALGMTDTANLGDKVERWEKAWAEYDFNLASEEVRLLPGVNSETKQADGSVRVYFDWDLVRSATDSTEEKTVTVAYYESWDFNADGKIWLTQVYGDETAAMAALNE